MSLHFTPLRLFIFKAKEILTKILQPLPCLAHLCVRVSKCVFIKQWWSLRCVTPPHSSPSCGYALCHPGQAVWAAKGWLCVYEGAGAVSLSVCVLRVCLYLVSQCCTWILFQKEKKEEDLSLMKYWGPFGPSSVFFTFFSAATISCSTLPRFEDVWI